MGQEEHLQQLQLNSSAGTLWQATIDSDGGSSIAGFVPDWSSIQLSVVGQLPTLLKLLEASGPAEAAEQLEPGSAIVLQWLGQHQVIDACLRYGIEGQGQLLRSVYDFCPRVLRVSSLLVDYRQNALLGKRLLQQPLQGISDACSGTAYSSGTAGSSLATKMHAIGVAATAANSAQDSSTSAADAAPVVPDAGATEVLEPAAAPLLDLQRNSSGSSSPGSPAAGAVQPTAASHTSGGGSSSDSSPGRSTEGHLHVLAQLQQREQWAFSQVSDVVFEELQQVLSGLSAEGFVQREAAVKALNEQWIQGCDELVEARRLGRRNILQKLMHQVCS